MVNLDPANDGVDDLAHAIPVESFEALTDLGGKRFQSADDERQLSFGVGGLSRCPLLFLELRYAQPQPGNARFELGLVDEAASIAVDEAIDPAPKRRHLAIEPHDLLWRASSVGGLTDASAVLVRHAARIFQQCSNLIPHHLLEPIAAHGWIAAFGRAVEPVRVRADAAVIVAHALRAIGWRERRRLGVIGIAAAAANRQALQQPTRAPSALALAVAVLVELRSRRPERGGVNQGQHRNLDPLLARAHDTPRRARHRSRIAPDQVQPLSCRYNARPPEHGASNIGRIIEHAADRRDAPMSQTPRTSAAHALQTSAHLAHAKSIQTNPRKDATHDVGLFLDDLEAGQSATLIAADVAISERRARQRADRTRAGGMQATTPNPLENLGALVLGDDALNLQQEIILRRVADRAVQEYHLGPGATKLLNQQDLMGVASCQPVGREQIDALDMRAGHRIAQLLQCRTLKVRAAAPIIHVAVIRLKLQAISGDALLQHRDLTVNRAIARLRLARYTRVKCHRAVLAHGSPLRRFAIIVLMCVGAALSRVGASRVRRTIGTRQA
ncbi:MAG TPA: hypothetical protein VM146_12075 [Steroidobacteraceae bacterium]|nr:hypothetical protein [Steroidobacteraceae bacterium]